VKTDKPARAQRRKIWHPAEYTVEDIRAIQSLALYAKAADDPKYKHLVPGPEDVKRALDWIILKAGQRDENPTAATLGEPDGERMAAFVDGRKSVADQIIKLMKLKPEHFKEHTDGGSLRQDARRKEDDGQG
jgi:hypothetical protein